MKKIHFVCLLSCLLLLAYCKKPYIDFPWEGGHDNDRKKALTLESMWFHYTNAPGDFRDFIFKFHYNNKQQLDSIVMDPQVVGAHTIFRGKNRIDSVVQTLFGPYHSGIRLNVRSGFEYDKFGNFTRFYINSVRTPGKQRVDLTYKHGHVHSITHADLLAPSLVSRDTFTYTKDDIVRWSAMLPDSTTDTRLYTYDQRHYNPLYYVGRDLLAIYSGYRFFWEFFLESEHVATSKFYPESQQLVKYENYYDSKGRLIKKVYTEPSFIKPDSLVFKYVK